MANVRKCSNCGANVTSNSKYCPYCGAEVEGQSSNPTIIINNVNSANNVQQGKECKKGVALALCFFLGFVGGHKFYEGKIGTGILYMCTGGLFLIGAIIDFFNILGKKKIYYV